MEELEISVRKLMREKEELQQVLEVQEEQASIALQEETHKLRVQNHELQHQVPNFTHCFYSAALWGFSPENILSAVRASGPECGAPEP